MRIRTPDRKEADKIYQLEHFILDDIATDKSTIEAKLQMFPEGFFIAEEKSEEEAGEEWEIVGLVSAVLWDSSFTPDFTDMYDNFTHTHTPSGNTMFIHTLAVHPDHRSKKIGTALLGEELNLAAHLKLEGVKIIARRKEIKVFERLGFILTAPLPEFLPHHQDLFPHPMLMEIKLG